MATVAHRLGLTGFVGNDTTGVFVEVEGDPESVTAFLDAVASEHPRLARIDRVTTTELVPRGDAEFSIVASQTSPAREALVTADAATCPDCLAEVRDPRERRFRYPFTNCTNCGPRYTIVRDVPYDRPNTTMAAFEMCAACRQEYDDAGDRRYHAQPVCCPACGPALVATGTDGAVVGADPIETAASWLHEGRIVAVKGLGGYHLAVAADNEAAVARLRSRKHREERPFAVMAADLEAARELCEVGELEALLLESAARPIVLMPRLFGAAVADAVAPRTRELGVMLPYTPLHHLLLEAVGRPIVLTSGNLSDEPIAYRDDDAFARLGGIADGFLTHDRAIQTRVDDSVVRSVTGRTLPLRRSRGYAPTPIPLAWAFRRPVLACGGELKNTICFGRGSQAILSPHIGDLENAETYDAFLTAVEHLGRLFAVTPEVVAYDLHPDYLATKHALDLDGVDLVGVQHHHAHIASCLADNGVAGPVIGVAFDGTGFGLDATVWGGEFLVADLATATRVARLEPVPLPGGAAAVRQPWRMAAAYLDALADGLGGAGTGVQRRQHERWHAVLDAARGGVNSPLTSSAGRLFDAVAALLDLRDEVSYEGQAAIELEQLADPAEVGGYGVRPATSLAATLAAALAAGVDNDAPATVRSTDLVRGVLADLAAGVAAPSIAARFHRGLADLVVATCRATRAAGGPSVVALSGGVFQNVLLLRLCVAGLESAEFAVLIHHQVPPNDGGLSLGQAAVAAARDRLRG